MLSLRSGLSKTDDLHPVSSIGELFACEGREASEPLNRANVESVQYHRKWFAIAGIAAIAGIIAHQFITKSRSVAPQVLSKGGRCPAFRLVCVNMKHAEQELFERAISAWLELGRDVQLLFETVTFFDESCTFGLDALPNATRHATLFAHRQLLRKKGEYPRRHKEGQDENTCLGCVFYQSTIQVNNEALGLEDCTPGVLQRLHGKPFLECHAVGFSIDGRDAVVRTHHVRGILDTARALRRWGPSGVRHVALEEILRYCNVPSCASFELTPSDSSSFHHTSLGAAVASHIGMHARTLNETPFPFYDSQFCERGGAYGAASHKADTSLVTLLWRSPFLLFCGIAAILPYSRLELDSFEQLLQPVLPQKTFRSLLGSRIVSYGVKLLPQRWTKDYAERFAKQTAILLNHCGSFSIVWLFSSSTRTLSSEGLTFLRRCLVSLAETMIGSKLSGVDMDAVFLYNENKGAVCDLGAFSLFLTVLQAEHVLRSFSTIMVCMGISLISVHLVAKIDSPEDSNYKYTNYTSQSAFSCEMKRYHNKNDEMDWEQAFLCGKPKFTLLTEQREKLQQMVEYFSTRHTTEMALGEAWSENPQIRGMDGVFCIVFAMDFQAKDASPHSSAGGGEVAPC